MDLVKHKITNPHDHKKMRFPLLSPVGHTSRHHVNEVSYIIQYKGISNSYSLLIRANKE